jgi:primosomal protein N' (replication factor Y)
MRSGNLFEPPADELYAEVAVPVPAAGPFTYSVPEPARSLVLPGSRVTVPFSGRRLTGIVVATRSRPPAGLAPEKLRPLGDCLDPLPLLSPLLLALTRWVAEETMSSWGETIRTALPVGLERVARRRVALTEDGRALLDGDRMEADGPASLPPAGAKTVGRGDAPADPPLPAGAATILKALAAAKSGTMSFATLARKAGKDAGSARLYELAGRGLLAIDDEWTAGVGGRWRELVVPGRQVSIERAREETARAPVQRRAVETLWERSGEGVAGSIAGRGSNRREAPSIEGRAKGAALSIEGGSACVAMAIDELCAAADCTPATIRALAGKRLVELRREAMADDPTASWSGGDDGAGSFELTAAQAEALGRIEAAEGGFHSFLLHGVTGSGKTEVYLRAARDVISRGRTAILLVPEIGLTPLLAHRARAVLGDAVGVMHSGMSAGERLSTWWRARSGAVRAVIGPRSAVFAPLPDVGLIVVDEEQDGAYKQDESPRYHGRDVALRRGLLEGAAVVLGSATPAVETYHAAAALGAGTSSSSQSDMLLWSTRVDESQDPGRSWGLLSKPSRAHAGIRIHERLRIADRVAGRRLPAVTLVDMRAEFQRSGRTLLSEALEAALADCLRRGEQGLLLLNRRGFAASLRCRSCGERLQCPECSVSLTYHRPQQELLCHHCGHRAPLPESCPMCGSRQLHEIGHGTQRLQQALGQLFPAARIRRFDADETRRKGAHAAILSAFARGDLDLLVGTQMLAKGHDFPGVTLVGAVGADDALGLPDFRAAERTFQLLTQMAGRAGRGDSPGTVVLQAYDPDHYAIRAAIEHDYEAFYAQEIAFRRRFGHPPFAALVACICRGKSAVVVKEEADVLAGALRRTAPEGVHVLGPASPPLAKLRGLHRIQVLLRGPDRSRLRDTLTAAVEDCRRRGKAPRDLRVDVDPLNLM